MRFQVVTATSIEMTKALWNVGQFLTDYKVQYPRRQSSFISKMCSKQFLFVSATP